MKCCKDCANAIFDEQWGEYKCKVVQHKVYDVEQYVACRDFKPRKETNETGVEKS